MRATRNLEPYIAEQLDIGIEWYPTDDAIIALQAFGKQVDSFIIQVTERRGPGSNPTAARLFDPESGGNVRLLYRGPSQRGRGVHRRHRVRRRSTPSRNCPRPGTVSA